MPTVPEKPPLAPAPVSSIFEASIYGYIEIDAIHDSTQSLNDAAGNMSIARPGTMAAQHDRTMFSARDSRLGIKLGGPNSAVVKSTGVLEMDFLGNQPQGSPAPAGSPSVSEIAYFTNPAFRMRHYYLKLATPYVDLLAGQTWSLFGWQGLYFPNLVQIPGVPGMLATRTPQFRASHLWIGRRVGVEIAAAVARPVQRNSGIPDGMAGLRFIVNGWRGLRTFGATGTGVDPLSIAVSGIARRFRLPEYTASPAATSSATGWGLSLDGLVPVIPATGKPRETALTVTGSFVRGKGIADQYSIFTGGVSFPALATGTYPQDVDNGLVAYTADGVLHVIAWQSYIVGLQLYLPLPFRCWLSANYSHTSSNNIRELVTDPNSPAAAKLFESTDWADGNLFVEVNAAVRFGLEYAWTRQTYLDGIRAPNQRIQLAAFYIF